MAFVKLSELTPTTKCSYRRSRTTEQGKAWMRQQGIDPNGRGKINCPEIATHLIDGFPFCDTHFNDDMAGTGRMRYRVHAYRAPTTKRKGGTYAIDPYYDSIEWRELRLRALKRDHDICQYCGIKAHQADHVVPRKKGGADHISNLVACCSICNKTAAGRNFKSFKEKKKWVLANRPVNQKKNNQRPKAILDQINRS